MKIFFKRECSPFISLFNSFTVKGFKIEDVVRILKYRSENN